MLNVEQEAEASPRRFLKCAVQHWYELRQPGADFGEENQKRYVAIDNLDRWRRRHGTDFVRGRILSALKGESATEVAFLFFGGFYFPNEPLIEKFVVGWLNSVRGDQRVAATYASLFFFEKNEEVPFILSQRVILEQEDALVVRASREALSIWADTRDGGQCRLCGATNTRVLTQRLQGLALRRASSK